MSALDQLLDLLEEGKHEEERRIAGMLYNYLNGVIEWPKEFDGLIPTYATSVRSPLWKAIDKVLKEIDQLFPDDDAVEIVGQYLCERLYDTPIAYEGPYQTPGYHWLDKHKKLQAQYQAAHERQMELDRKSKEQLQAEIAAGRIPVMWQDF